jgi:prepilin-type N-terminal cleavage/methylation domain-containing protein
MRGYTLIELLTVLTLLAVGASSLAPTARRVVDLAAVTTAREEVIAAFTEARGRAMAAGGSSVTILTEPPGLRIHEHGILRRSVVLDSDGSLEVGLSGGRDSTEIRFDALGLGRFASETIVLERGDASVALIVSSYGRIRRR